MTQQNTTLHNETQFLQKKALHNSANFTNNYAQIRNFTKPGTCSHNLTALQKRYKTVNKKLPKFTKTLHNFTNKNTQLYTTLYFTIQHFI